MSNPLDTEIISKLAKILDKTNLTELEYEDEGCRISLVRNLSGVAATSAYVPQALQAVARTQKRRYNSLRYARQRIVVLRAEKRRRRI